MSNTIEFPMWVKTTKCAHVSHRYYRFTKHGVVPCDISARPSIHKAIRATITNGNYGK